MKANKIMIKLTFIKESTIKKKIAFHLINIFLNLNNMKFHRQKNSNLVKKKLKNKKIIKIYHFYKYNI